MASKQSITVEYVVTGSLDGVTPAPPIVTDGSAVDRTSFDQAAQIYRVEVENLGIIDPDLGVGGSIGPRCVPFMWIDTEELGDPGASVDVVGVVEGTAKSQTQVADLAGEAGAYLDGGIMVPQGSAISVDGFAAAADQPIIVRVSIFVPANCADFALAVIAREAASPFTPPVLGGGERNIGFVNLNNGDDATGAIGTLRPFKTIQAFLDAVPPSGDPSEARNEYAAIIAPGDYDEDLAVDLSGRRIILTSFGVWGLGTFDGPDWGPSGTPRNITVTATGGPIDGIRPGLVIGGLLSIGEGMTTHEAYLTKVRISGKIDLTGAAGVGSVELTLSCEIFGDGGVSVDAGAAIIQSYIYRSRMRGSMVGSNWQFQVAQRSRFGGLIDVDNYSLFQSCRIDAGMTIAGSGFAGLRPNGILLSTFSGTYTGGAGSFNLDAYTNWWQKTFNPAGVTVAQKTIQGDLSP